MKQLALTAIVAAGLLAAGACEREAGPQANPNAQTPQASASRPAPGAPPPGEAAAPTPSRPAGPAGIAAQTAFDTADQDKDGKVDSAEASAVPGLDFAAADTNKDASLSRQEYLGAIALGSRPRG
jgi:hypothetical protein